MAINFCPGREAAMSPCSVSHNAALVSILDSFNARGQARQRVAPAFRQNGMFEERVLPRREDNTAVQDQGHLAATETHPWARSAAEVRIAPAEPVRGELVAEQAASAREEREARNLLRRHRVLARRQ